MKTYLLNQSVSDFNLNMVQRGLILLMLLALCQIMCDKPRNNIATSLQEEYLANLTNKR